MRIAAALLPHLPSAAEAQRAPELKEQPLIVGNSDRATTVLDCSPSALAAGVRPDMPVRQAMSRCPEATFLPSDLGYYRHIWDAVLVSLEEISPEVEDARLGRAYLNLTGLERHYTSDLDLGEGILRAVGAASGLDATLGIGDSKFLSLAAAVVSAPGEVTFVPTGQGGDFLSPLDISLVPVSGAAQERLRLLGLESIGEVAAIPLSALETQFGPEGKRLWELSNGRDSEPLRPRPRVELLEESLSFETPVVGIEVLLAGSRQLFSRLRLPLRGRAARELSLRAELTSGRRWEKRVVFREAVSEESRLLFILKSALSASPPPALVTALTLRLCGLTGETGKQLTFGDKSRLQRQLEETIRQLKARYGFSPIYRCVDVEPWSMIPEERRVLVESDA